MSISILVAFAAVVLTPLVTYLVSVRRLSGKIGTSAAEDLWTESRSIREDLQERNEFLTGKITKLEERIDSLEERNRALYLENGKLRILLEEQTKTISTLRDEVNDLRLDNKRLGADNDRLRGRVKELEDHNDGA